MYKKTLPSSLVICSHFSVLWRFCRAILTAHCSYTKKSEPVMEKNLHLPPRSKSLDTIPFLIGFCSVFAFIISSLVFPEGFINFMDTLQAQMAVIQDEIEIVTERITLSQNAYTLMYLAAYDPGRIPTISDGMEQ